MPRTLLSLPVLSLLLLPLLFVAGPRAAHAQGGAAAPSAILDLPVTATERARVVGTYTMTMTGQDLPPMTLRIFEQAGVLMGAVNDNDPTRMLSQGDDVFRPEAAPVFELAFQVRGARADRIAINSPDGPAVGVRIRDDATVTPSPGTATSGPLFDELARLDSLMFDASFVQCDIEARNALFTDDVEFYHDKNGFSAGADVRKPITECPRDQGLTRELVAGSLEVYPLDDYGAVQTGTHRFREAGAPGATVARFVHVWKKENGTWKISRVLSFDHRSE